MNIRLGTTAHCQHIGCLLSTSMEIDFGKMINACTVDYKEEGMKLVTPPDVTDAGRQRGFAIDHNILGAVGWIVRIPVH